MASLLDAQALIAFARAEPAGPKVRTILRKQDSATTAINLAEVVQRLVRGGVDEATVRGLIEPLPLRVIAIDTALAWQAGIMRSRHYRRRSNEVSLADCCLVAAADAGDTVVTGDRGVIAMAQAEGLKVVAL